jgi:hypothetical protein
MGEMAGFLATSKFSSQAAVYQLLQGFRVLISPMKGAISVIESCSQLQQIRYASWIDVTQL